MANKLETLVREMLKVASFPANDLSIRKVLEVVKSYPEVLPVLSRVSNELSKNSGDFLERANFVRDSLLETFKSILRKEVGFGDEQINELFRNDGVRHYLNHGYGTIIWIFRPWAIHTLDIDEDKVDEILVSILPGICATRIIDLSTEHFDHELTYQIIPLLHLFHRKCSLAMSQSFNDWWSILSREQAIAEHLEMNQRWKLPSDESWYSVGLLGSKGITTAIVPIGCLIQAGKSPEEINHYVEIVRTLGAAAQLMDDLKDWREDLVVGRISLPIYLALKHESISISELKSQVSNIGSKREDLSCRLERKLIRGLFFSRTPDIVYRRAEEYYIEAWKHVDAINDWYWKMVFELKVLDLRERHSHWIKSIEHQIGEMTITG